MQIHRPTVSRLPQTRAMWRARGPRGRWSARSLAHVERSWRRHTRRRAQLQCCTGAAASTRHVHRGFFDLVYDSKRRFDLQQPQHDLQRPLKTYLQYKETIGFPGKNFAQVSTPDYPRSQHGAFLLNCSNRCSFAHPASYFLHPTTLITFFAGKIIYKKSLFCTLLFFRGAFLG